MLSKLALEVKTSFHEVSLIFLELISLLQELPLHVSISILRCCCSLLNLRCPSKNFFAGGEIWYSPLLPAGETPHSSDER